MVFRPHWSLSANNNYTNTRTSANNNDCNHRNPYPNLNNNNNNYKDTTNNNNNCNDNNNDNHCNSYQKSTPTTSKPGATVTNPTLGLPECMSPRKLLERWHLLGP